MATALNLSEGDLHGLVDGRLDPARRNEALRALASSPRERAKVEAWQEQNDLIRATFASVEDEPLPPSMRLVAPPALHCVPSPVTTMRQPSASGASRRRSHAMTGAGVLVFTAGVLGFSWLVLQRADETPQVVDLGLRSGPSETIAMVSADAIGDDPTIGAKPDATGAVVAPPPTTRIPDLTAAGFVFTRAESRPTAPQSLVFYYKDARAEHVVVSVARTQSTPAQTAPARAGGTPSWRRGANTFTLTGSLRPERLQAIATLVKGASEER